MDSIRVNPGQHLVRGEVESPSRLKGHVDALPLNHVKTEESGRDLVGALCHDARVVAALSVPVMADSVSAACWAVCC